jgi:hypothetical protein
VNRQFETLSNAVLDLLAALANKKACAIDYAAFLAYIYILFTPEVRAIHLNIAYAVRAIIDQFVELEITFAANELIL